MTDLQQSPNITSGDARITCARTPAWVASVRRRTRLGLPAPSTLPWDRRVGRRAASGERTEIYLCGEKRGVCVGGTLGDYCRGNEWDVTRPAKEICSGGVGFGRSNYADRTTNGTPGAPRRHGTIRTLRQAAGGKQVVEDRRQIERFIVYHPMEVMTSTMPMSTPHLRHRNR